MINEMKKVYHEIEALENKGYRFVGTLEANA
jgi:hypothetical protein